MKKFFIVLATVVAAVVAFSSCNKEENNYPSHISGYWEYQNGSTGMVYSFEVTDIAGGQTATFVEGRNTLPYEEVTGSFVYDSNTGTGTLTTPMVGAFSVTVKVRDTTGNSLSFVATKGDAEGTIVSGVFTKTTKK